MKTLTAIITMLTVITASYADELTPTPRDKRIALTNDANNCHTHKVMKHSHP